jgi:hypothetical protein
MSVERLLRRNLPAPEWIKSSSAFSCRTQSTKRRPHESLNHCAFLGMPMPTEEFIELAGHAAT